MTDSIGEHAHMVLKAHDMWSLPVDPFAIAAAEAIELAPGYFGPSFDARIEYYSEVSAFGIFYRDSGHSGRIRFSLSHELGHFYLPRHRQYLRYGRLHNSVTNFRSKAPIEREADEFASNLLMPRPLFVEAARFRYGNICDLNKLSRFADFLDTSLTSTVVRYCTCGPEACSTIISEEGRLLWAFHSEEMKLLGMGWVESIPPPSLTAETWKRIRLGESPSYQGRAVSSDVWFARPHRRYPELWEEVLPLGTTGQVLTFLTAQEA